MSISTWACSEVFGFWCSYVLPVSVLDLLDSLMHLAQLTRTLSLFISLHLLPLTILFYLLLCPSTHTFPVCFVSLCLSGSVLQCSNFFLHLPFTQYSKVPNLILSPSPISFNGLASDVTMYLISQAENHQVILDLFSPTSSWFSMRGCSCLTPYLHAFP